MEDVALGSPGRARSIAFGAASLVQAALIWWLSSIPGSAIPPLQLVGIDKVLHAIVFGVLGFLAFRACANGGLSLRSAAIVAIGVASLYGVVDEIHQRTTPGRFSSVTDVAADSIGAILAVLSALSLERKRAHGGP